MNRLYTLIPARMQEARQREYHSSKSIQVKSKKRDARSKKKNPQRSNNETANRHQKGSQREMQQQPHTNQPLQRRVNVMWNVYMVVYIPSPAMETEPYIEAYIGLSRQSHPDFCKIKRKERTKKHITARPLFFFFFFPSSSSFVIYIPPLDISSYKSS